MSYEKCRNCRLVCRCCNSHDDDQWPRCNECPSGRFEFQPAKHINYCPLDGTPVKRPLFDIYGCLVREE